MQAPVPGKDGVPDHGGEGAGDQELLEPGAAWFEDAGDGEQVGQRAGEVGAGLADQPVDLDAGGGSGRDQATQVRVVAA